MTLTSTNNKCVAVIATKRVLTPLVITILKICEYLDSSTDLVVLIEPGTLTTDQQLALHKIHKNIKIKEINIEKYSDLKFGSPWRAWTYNCGYRFEIFSLQLYEKVFYIDLDVQINLNFLEIFNLSTNLGFCKNFDGTIPEFKNYSAFNAGVCLIGKNYLRPSITTELIKIASSKKYSSDEAVIFSLFGNKYDEMPSEFNTLSTFIINKQIYYDAKMIHFIGVKKPWNSKFQDSFDEYVLKKIGVYYSYFLYKNYKKYYNDIINNNHAHCKLILG